MYATHRPKDATQDAITIPIVASASPGVASAVDPGARVVATLRVPVPMHLPWEKRTVRVGMCFGGTEIKVSAAPAFAGEEGDDGVHGAGGLQPF